MKKKIIKKKLFKIFETDLMSTKQLRKIIDSRESTKDQ